MEVCMKQALYTLGILIAILALFTPVSTSDRNPVSVPLYDNIAAKFKAAFDIDDTVDLQVPIPRDCRIPNRTGSQCVWSSHETLARYAYITPLYDLTRRPEYGGRAGSASAASMLHKFRVNYQMTVVKDFSLLERACAIEHRGVAFDVPGHMMTMVHFDKVAGVVKYIDNSDSTLSVRTMSMETFKKQWCGWAVVIYGSPDQLPLRLSPWQGIPVLDEYGRQQHYGFGHLPSPNERNW